MSQPSGHSNSDDSQEHPTVAPQVPFLSSTNTPEQSSQSQSTIPQIHKTTNAGDKQHHRRSPGALERLEETWYIESFFLLCSGACAVLIVTFLAVHDNTNIESWHFRFASINTVVSVLGTIFKSTLLMAVSAALAQETIDAGSRGTVGSLKLLLHLRGQHLVCAGALVMALAFMIEPFLQSTISSYGRLVDTDPSNTNAITASIGRSRRFDGGTLLVDTYASNYPQVETTPDFTISASLYDGLDAAGGHGYHNVYFTCMIGNCTWPEFVSIAIHSTCFDVSDHLKRTSSEDQAQTTASPTSLSAATGSTDTGTEIAIYPTALSTLSDVLTVNSMVAPIQSTATRATTSLNKRAPSHAQSSSTRPSQSAAMWADWTLDYLDLTLSNTNQNWRQANTFAVLQAAVVADPNLTINFKTSQTLLAAFTTIRADDSHPLGSADWDAANASAMECGLELALNVYNSSVVNGILSEQIVASVSQKVPGSWLPLPGIDQSMLHPDGLKADPGTLGSNPIYHDTFLYRDDYTLDPTALQGSDAGSFNITQKALLSTVDFLTSLIPQNNGNATVRAVVQDEQFVLYMYGSPILQPLFSQKNTTATFDALAKSISNAIRNLGTEPMTKQWVRFFRVRWAFLALPLSLITIGSIFFILSIVEAHKARVPNWKANIIATMIFGPDEPLQGHLRSQNHVYSLGVASKTVAKLEWFPEGFALTAAEQPATKISRPTTPRRDEEEQYEMDNLNVPNTSQTPGSAITLVESQDAGAAEPGDIQPVSPIGTGPGWSDIQIHESTTPLGIRRTF